MTSKQVRGPSKNWHPASEGTLKTDIQQVRGPSKLTSSKRGDPQIRGCFLWLIPASGNGREGERTAGMQKGWPGRVAVEITWCNELWRNEALPERGRSPSVRKEGSVDEQAYKAPGWGDYSRRKVEIQESDVESATSSWRFICNPKDNQNEEIWKPLVQEEEILHGWIQRGGGGFNPSIWCRWFCS